MSLWTPQGEHDIPEETPSEGEAISDVGELPGFDDLSPDEQEQARAMAAELADARKRLSEAPAAEVIANHVMGIYELAAIHLSNQPPSIDEAKVAIDAMAGIMSSLSGRLGQNESVLREALQQIQVAFVQISDTEKTPEQPESGDASEAEDT
ncbi:MAG: hypothetical protein L7S58_04520 [Acidimicrobiales bacterium]|nr:hypothetical protein [Acidimicrobiales bacterium]|tara:strand:- start:59 stop:514 length:456 start_codon:yes stop_codon:yes gene_type:complete